MLKASDIDDDALWDEAEKGTALLIDRDVEAAIPLRPTGLLRGLPGYKIWSPKGGTHAVQVDSSASLVGLTIIGNQTRGHGIRHLGDSLEVIGCRIGGVGAYGIGILPEAGGNVTISNCRIHKTGADGIDSKGEVQGSIRGCLIEGWGDHGNRGKAAIDMRSGLEICGNYIRLPAGVKPRGIRARWPTRMASIWGNRIDLGLLTGLGIVIHGSHVQEHDNRITAWRKVIATDPTAVIG